MQRLTDYDWDTGYDSEDGDLVKAFFEPAPSCAKKYDRTTGYFSAGVLSLAARGINSLIDNQGSVRLVVGRTLNPAETDAMKAGYSIREQLEKKLLEIDLTPSYGKERSGLEQLAWMIAENILDVKVAVPVDSSGQPVLVDGIYHAKVGIINETAAG